MSVSFCLPHPVAVSAFMICRGLCACTEMLWMCVLYVSFIIIFIIIFIIVQYPMYIKIQVQWTYKDIHNNHSRYTL